MRIIAPWQLKDLLINWQTRTFVGPYESGMPISKEFSMNFKSSRARITPALLVFVALTLGFAVADLTGIRWLGGLVMVVIGAVAVFSMNRSVGLLRTLIGVVAVVAGFILSHALGSALGSYGALLLVATVCALVVYLLGFNTEKNKLQ